MDFSGKLLDFLEFLNLGIYDFRVVFPDEFFVLKMLVFRLWTESLAKR